jgi:hypothetical protein
MLRLLLDEHFSVTIPEHVRRLRPECEIIGMQVWERGYFLGKPDEDILRRAAEQSLTLVTYDQRTINPLLAGLDGSGDLHLRASGQIGIGGSQILLLPYPP